MKLTLPETKPYWWPNVNDIIALLIIVSFDVVLFADPGDDTMKGALIAAFAGAWGYYLGSSSSAKRANDRADVAADTANLLAAATAPTVTTTITQEPSAPSPPGPARDGE